MLARSCARKWSASTPDRGQVVDRHREEPVHLRRVQRHGEHPVAPAVASMSATSRPPIEMRGASFLSERA